jgi:sulfite reductase (ferredoxin)
VFISAAKALLLDKGVNSSTHAGIIREFDNHYVATGEIEIEGSFNDLILQINKNEPSEAFATQYLQQAKVFLQTVKDKREALIQL